MDEREIQICAQVAVKAATEIAVAQINNGITPTLETWNGWYAHFGKSIIDTVKRAIPQPAPPVAPQSSQPFPTAPTAAPMPQQPQNQPTTNGQPYVAPFCSKGHGPMIPGPGQTKGKGPLWRCSQSNWDFQRKEETGCPEIVWGADTPA